MWLVVSLPGSSSAQGSRIYALGVAKSTQTFQQERQHFYDSTIASGNAPQSLPSGALSCVATLRFELVTVLLCLDAVMNWHGVAGHCKADWTSALSVGLGQSCRRIGNSNSTRKNGFHQQMNIMDALATQLEAAQILLLAWFGLVPGVCSAMIWSSWCGICAVRDILCSTDRSGFMTAIVSVDCLQYLSVLALVRSALACQARSCKCVCHIYSCSSLVACTDRTDLQ
eukprot:6490394-Amphidinium_carterae.2